MLFYKGLYAQWFASLTTWDIHHKKLMVTNIIDHYDL